MRLGGITQRMCSCLDVVCFAYMKICVKESGGEVRGVVGGRIVRAFLEMGRWGQTVLVLSRF